MKKNKFLYISLLLSIFIPLVSFAAPLEGIKSIILAGKDIINTLFPALVGLAILFFFWGTAQFILNGSADKSREEGKKKMLWGVIALFVMVSIIGILNFIGNVFDITPQFLPGSSQSSGKGAIDQGGFSPGGDTPSDYTTPDWALPGGADEVK